MLPSPGLSTLLDLDGNILDQGDGYWVKIDAHTVEPTAEIPHGIRYSLRCMNPMARGFSATTTRTR